MFQAGSTQRCLNEEPGGRHSFLGEEASLSHNQDRDVLCRVAQLNENSSQPSSGQKRQLEEDIPSSCDSDVPVVYTDGACSGNGQRGAKAGIGL